MSKLPTSRLPVTPSKIATAPKSGLRPPQTSSTHAPTSQQTSPSATAETTAQSFVVGDRVTANGKTGTVGFIGATKFADGEWIGVILDDAQGKNDGSYEGVRYFETEPNRGLFCRPAKVQRLVQAAGASKDTDSTTKTVDVPKSQVETDKPATQDLQVGDRVVVSGSKFGTLRYLGKIHVAEGIWCGIQLDEAQGKNDGSVSGKRYFTCQQRYGLFSPVARVEKVNNDTNQTQAAARKESVSSSTANSRPLHRSNSQESLHSNLSELSSSNSISRIPTRTPGKLQTQKMPTHQYTTPNTKSLLTQAAATLAATQPSSTQVATLIQTLKEKDIFIEKLQQQREQDRLEFSRAAQQVDEMESRMLAFKQQLDTKESENEQLKKEQYETKQRLEDLEFQLEEYKLNETNREQTSAPTIPEGYRLLTPKDIEVYEDIKGKVLTLESTNQKLNLEKQTLQDEHRQELKRQVNTHDQEQQNHLKEINSIKSKVDEYEQQNQQLKVQLAEILNNGENQSKILLQQIEESNKELDEVRAQLKSIQDEKGTNEKLSNERLSQLEALLNKEQNETKTLVQQIEEIRSQLKSAYDEKDATNKALSEHLSQLKNYEENIVPQLKLQLSELLSSGENQTTVLGQQLQESQSKLEKANHDIEDIRAQLKSVQDEKEANEKISNERLAQLKNYEDTILPQLKSQLSELLSSGENQTTVLGQQLQECQSKLEKANHEIEEVRSQLKSVQEGKEANEKILTERLTQLKNYEDNIVPQLKSQLSELLSSGENQTTVLGQQLQENQSKLEKATLDIEEVRSQLKSAQDDKEASEKISNERFSQLKHYEENIIPQLKSQLSELISSSENQKTASEQQLQENQSKLEKANHDIEEIRSQLKSVQDEKEASEKISNERLAQLKNYEDTILPQLKSQLSELLSSGENQTAVLGQQLQEYQSKLEKANQDIEEIRSQLKSSEDTKKSMDIQLQDYQSKLEQAMKDDEQIRSQLTSIKDERDGIGKQLNEYLAKLKNYEEVVIPQLEKESQTLKSDLENRDRTASTTLTEHQSQLEEKIKALHEQHDKTHKELAESNESLREELENIQTKYQQLQKTHQESSTSSDNELNEKQALIDQLNKKLQTVQQEKLQVDQKLQETIEQYETKFKSLNSQSVVQKPIESNNDTQPVEELQSQIDFLNDVIVDLKNANETLKKEIEFLKNPYLDDNDQLETADVQMRTKTSAPRLYCDMCEVFDQHDTDDCPKQSSMADDQPLSTDPTRERVIPPPRAYCDKCEEFGHDCNEADETY